jgi:hypothetical protein
MEHIYFGTWLLMAGKLSLYLFIFTDREEMANMSLFFEKTQEFAFHFIEQEDNKGTTSTEEGHAHTHTHDRPHQATTTR